MDKAYKKLCDARTLLYNRNIKMHDDDILFLCDETEERMKNKTYKDDKAKNAAYKRIFFGLFDKYKANLRYEDSDGSTF